MLSASFPPTSRGDVPAASILQQAGTAYGEVCASLGEALDTGLLSDVVLRVGTKEIHAHKAILAARSPVFCAMFTTDMRESRAQEVELEDVEPEAVGALVRFLYTGEVLCESLETEESALSLLQAAHRYGAATLVETCTQVLCSNLEVETAIDRLLVADLIQVAEFKTHCLEFISANLADVQMTESYERLVEKRPALLRDIISTMCPPSRKSCPREGVVTVVDVDRDDVPEARERNIQA